MSDDRERKPNRLINSTSPYLLQHAYNPVDWYSWGSEALEKARAEDKPILLSIGYSSCHWCHVMAHESFEDPEIAALMNANFVNIKVDREERPDLDSIYMEAVQAMTGHGGWPMTMFLAPSGVPFFGGTYFPPTPRHGIMAFPQVLQAVAEAYREQRDKIEQNEVEMRRFLAGSIESPPSRQEPNVTILDTAARTALSQFDRTNGGTEGAPKFPQPMNIEFLLREHRRTGSVEHLAVAETTLEKMALGGIYDQVGGGFHRYSVDEVWLVPHFEKMLYDNAQLARVYLAAFQITGKALYRRVAEQTLDYVLREMTTPEGGFYSSQDADSEGVEGKFYVWTPGEIGTLLGDDDGSLFSRVFDVTEGGNFEGQSILHYTRPPEEWAAELRQGLDEFFAWVDKCREKLYEARSKRVWPGRDDKVLAGWNGLMLRAFSEASSILGRADYREAAIRNGEFVERNLGQSGAPGEELRIFRTIKDGEAHIDAFAEDYALYADGLLSLYEATFEPRHVQSARGLLDTLTAHFYDNVKGGFYSTADYHEALVARPKDLYDNAIPSANSVAAEALVRLYLLTAEGDYEKYAVEAMRPVLDALGRAPTAFGRMLCALDLYLGSPVEVALVGDFSSADMEGMLRAVWRHYAPNKVVAAGQPGDAEAARIVPLLADRPQVKGRATAYLCRNYICLAPSTDPEEVGRGLQASGPARDEFVEV